jgi:hypothetical protein
MFISLALVLLIALAPAYGLIGGNTSTGLVAAVASVAFASAVASLRVGPAEKLTRLLRPALGVALLTPLAWMVVQMAPIPLGWFSDPVWASTSAALDTSIAGSISIDTGATLLAVVRYCAVLATAVTAAALACDRRSAARALYLLTAIAGTVAASQITRDFGYFRWLHPSDSESGSVLIAAIGIVVSCSVLIRLYGQHASKKIVAQPWATIAFIGTTAGLFLCTLSLLISGDGAGLFAAFFGAGVPVALFAIRTWSLRIWGSLGVAAIAAMALVGFLAVTPFKTDVDPALALAPDQSTAVELMLSNVPPLGTGAGSLQDILPIYRELNLPTAPPNVTAATVIAGEMGKSFLWLLLGTLAIAAATLIRDSSRRRRDYVYAASGAGILLAFSLLIFVDSNVLGLPASLLAGVALGLAWAQGRASNEDARFAREMAEPDPTTSAGRKRGGHSHQLPIRLACGAFALLLMMQACWILIPSFYLSRSSPGAPVSAVGAAARNENLDKAASIALVRGDLWGSSALARAASMENNGAANSGSVSVRDHLVKALVYAPYQPKIWLTFAQLADQFKWTRYNASALLKMVYYTGASEIDLVPPRTKLALRLDDATADFELRDMIKRDVELILRLRPELKPALVEAYKSATPAGRALTDGVVARLEPRLLGTLRNQ